MEDTDILSMDELIEEADREEEELAKMVQWKDGWLTLDNGNYDIREDRIETIESLVCWIKHLSEKVWVTSPMINRIIDLWGKRWKKSTDGLC